MGEFFPSTCEFLPSFSKNSRVFLKNSPKNRQKLARVFPQKLGKNSFFRKTRKTRENSRVFAEFYNIGPYTITKVVGENAFELTIPPLLGLHPVFNVELLQHYFPPLLDTSDTTEQLAPTELNPDCIEQATVDRIMDTKTKDTRQQTIQLYQVLKSRQFLHQGKW
jgi:hypothetical protein